MRALIVDDERLARKELMRLLNDYPEVEDIVEFGNANDAMAYLESEHADLLFLDIQMPGKNGFEMLEGLESVPQVIFVTAYDEYAIRAFEYNALDYLLKPVEEHRFSEAMTKVIAELKKSKKGSREFNVLGPEDKVFVKDGEKCWFVKLADVKLFESEGNYVRVYFNNHKPMILRSLNNLEARLDSRKYFRANRKYIINLDRVEQIENWFNGGLLVTLETGKQIEISRRQSTRLKEMMSL